MSKVYIVGAGPGDVDLITVKGLKAIQKADVILYDRLINKDLLKDAKKGAELIYSGKTPGFHGKLQTTINELLVKHAKAGKIVTRLKGGDPFIFGRGGEEAQYLAQNGIPFEIVPGITSGIAAPAYAGIPVTHRDYGSTFAIVAGQKKDEGKELDWESLAKGIDTLAIYMGVANLPYICEQLITHGRAKTTPIALIHWGTTNVQQTVTGTLADIVDIVKKEKVSNPSVIVIGDVVELREELQWFEHREILQYAALV